MAIPSYSAAGDVLDDKTLKAMRHGALNGDVEAQFVLGSLYLRGGEVPQNENEGEFWLQMAINNGDEMATTELGKYFLYKGFQYEEGIEKPLNYREAFKYYRKSAFTGYAYGQYFLGLMYYEGKGTPRNVNSAADWFTKAAEQGHHESQRIIGLMYYHGEGLPKSKEQSLKWLTRASELGNSQAAKDLIRISKSHKPSHPE